MNSCLYECSVMHCRLAPKKHQFRYRIFMFYLDLDELEELSKRRWLFGRNRTALFSFRDEDHVTVGESDLRRNLSRYLADHGMPMPADARVMLLTLPRVLGYIFNPISLYFIFDREGKPCSAVVEVRNTFHEMKLYLLREPGEEGGFRLVVPKEFYVSPFSDLDLCFDFQLKPPGERLSIAVDDVQGGRKMLVSTLTGRQAPLTDRQMAWYALKYPFITLKVILLIHWHALLLWLKGLPFHLKTANREGQRDVLRPHSSLHR